MRYLLLLLFFVIAQLTYGQRFLPIAWKTDRGIIDTGRMERLAVDFNADDPIKLVLKHGHEIEVAQEIIEWIVYAGDTLLVRHELAGERRLWRLLYQGPVQLYKVLQKGSAKQYVLMRGTRREILEGRNADRVGRMFVTGDCQRFKYPKMIAHDQQAVELVRRINECLESENHYVMPGFAARRSRVGVVYNRFTSNFSEYDDRFYRLANAQRITTVYERPFYAPRLWLTYQREIIRYLPNFKSSLDLGILHRRTNQTTVVLNDFFPLLDVEERQRINAIYLFPGVQYETNPNRIVKFSFGLGPAFALPIFTEREVRVLPGNVPTTGPQVQKTNNFIDTRMGFHYSFGMQISIYRRLRLVLGLRHEELEKRVEFEGLDRRQIYFTENFLNNVLVGTKRARRWQVGMSYDY